MTLGVRIGTFDAKMRVRFRHATADRGQTDNVIVEVVDGQGGVGYGEGCPRSYVTGETQDTALAWLSRWAPDCVSQCASQWVSGGTAQGGALEALAAWMARHQTEIDHNPAAFCALELALLDLMGQRQNTPVEVLLGGQAPGVAVAYTGVLGASAPRKIGVMVAAYRAMGFTDFKVKLDGDLAADRARLAKIPGGATLRVDANTLWHNPGDAIAHVRALKRPVWAIEEPLTPGDVAGMAEIGKALGVKIILDESVFRLDHLPPFMDEPGLWIANIRVSKVGGIVRSIALANACHDAGMGVIVGAQVGETSLLTRAALAVGQETRAPIMAREGGYGRILLLSDVVRPSLRFGFGGRLDPKRFGLGQAPGLGLSIMSERMSWIHAWRQGNA